MNRAHGRLAFASRLRRVGRRLGISYLVILPLLSACLPNATTYYQPTADGGLRLAGHCVPAQSNIAVPVGPLPVEANAIQGHGDVIVGLTLVARRPLAATGQPSWQTLHFSNGDFSIRDLDRNVALGPL